MGSVCYLYEDAEARLWKMGPSGEAVAVGTRADQIYEVVQSMSEVRLCGARHQTSLVLDVLEGGLQAKYPVALCTPRLCRPEERGDPNSVLSRMRACALPASVGGWHAVGESDYISYSLASMFDLEQFNLAGHLLFEHPVYRFLTFIPQLDLPATARVLADILDPRWFVDANHPGRCGRLYRYFGLDPRTMEAVIGGDPVGIHFERCRAILGMWYDESQENLPLEPRRFLWSIYDWHGRGAKGFLRASQRLLSWIRALWLSQVSKEMPFTPEDFFWPDEAEVFREHIGRT